MDRKKSILPRNIESQLQSKRFKWWQEPHVEIVFNLPRISARLERLMGTNVVRLTDRKYMYQLRTRMEQEYRKNLEKRIEQRQKKEERRVKRLIFRGAFGPSNCPPQWILFHSIALSQEMERERNLILESKVVHEIPEMLATNPILIVNRKTNEIIAKRRSKLKTVRERNAEQLIRQGIKWEKERLAFEEKEKERERKVKADTEKARLLEEQYRSEDAVKGMDLLRIYNQDWHECELDLKNFLEKEDQELKQKVRRKSIQFVSDPLDIQNVIRARREFRKKQRSRKGKDKGESVDKAYQRKAMQTAESKKTLPEQTEKVQPSKKKKIARRLVLDSSDEISEENESEDRESVKIDDDTFLEKLRAEMDEDARLGHIATQEQYEQLHYEDPKVAELKRTDNVRDLYAIAEEIIIGVETPPGSEEDGEEFEEEQEVEVKEDPKSKKRGRGGAEIEVQ